MLIFAVLLIVVAGKNGFLAIFSFLITVLTVWKILVPAYLKGYSPVWIGIFITLFLTVMIIFFVYGFDKRTLAASSGAMLGILTTCVLGMLFTDMFRIIFDVFCPSCCLIMTFFNNLFSLLRKE